MTPTILVVDDHPATCTLIQRILTPHGYAVATVADGEAALVAATTQRPDLVIADVFLPGLDGLMVIDRLRQQDPQLPVIAMSAAPEVLGRQETAPAGLDLGSIAFLAKPFSLATLQALVQSVMPLLIPG
jgi:CheY-like chemotaxis protein